MSYGINNFTHNNLAGGVLPHMNDINTGAGVVSNPVNAPLPGQPGSRFNPGPGGGSVRPVHYPTDSPQPGQPGGGPASGGGAMNWGGTGTYGPNAPMVPTPQTNANPYQPFYLQNPTMLNPTLMQGAQSNAQTNLDPSFMQSLGPQSTIQQILQGFAPQAQQSTNALNSQLAAMGIEGGGALDAQTRLQSQLAGALAPTLAGAIQNSQGNQLQGNEFGIQGGLQQALQNAGLAQDTGHSNMQASNTTNGINLGNILQQEQYNTGVANQGQNNLANAIQNAYYNNMNAFNNVNLAGLSGQQGVIQTGLGIGGNLAGQAANNFPVYQGSPFAGLGAAIGGAFNSSSGGSGSSSADPAPFGGIGAGIGAGVGGGVGGGGGG